MKKQPRSWLILTTLLALALVAGCTAPGSETDEETTTTETAPVTTEAAAEPDAPTETPDAAEPDETTTTTNATTPGITTELTNDPLTMMVHIESTWSPMTCC